MAWELKGKYPTIFDDVTVGNEAKKLFDDAQRLLDDIVATEKLEARGVYGFFPANSDGDDIILFDDENRQNETGRIHTLRQQWERRGQETFYALADFVAPVSCGRKDYVGAFACTAGHGCNEFAEQFDKDHDDYN